MDESYIHQHYCCHNDLLFDPTNPISVKAKHKGRRLCFIGTIIDEDRSVDVEARTGSHSTGLLLETLDILEGGSQTVDYHGMFCHAYFVAWMARLLQCLRERGIAGYQIVVDNAKHHKSLPDSVPRSGSKKQVTVDAREQYGIPVQPSETKPIVWGKLSEHIRTNIDPVAAAMVRAEGHIVVYTPSHHSDLQPIEMIWTIVKGEVGRQYTTNTTFGDIRRRSDAAFNNLKPTTVQKCIDITTKQLLLLKKHLEIMDEQDESQEEEEEGEEEDDTE